MDPSHLIRLPLSVIKNSKGDVVTLNEREQYTADRLQREVNERFCNSLGYEVPITTLTTIMKRISTQKFFEVAPSTFLPVRVGDGAWSSNLTTYRSFAVADQFETGIINVGGQNDRLASADAAIDALNIKVFDWAKSIGWSIIELEKAAKSGNWDIVSSKERARKENWDLGIQRIAFLGARGQNGSNGTCLGLLNQPGVTVNNTLITQPLSTLDPAGLKAFVAAVMEAYRSNCQRTAYPDIFQIPESDFNGLASQASPTYPIKSTLDLLTEAFRVVTMKPDFKILPLSYGDAAYHADVAAIAGKQVYTLLRYDEESLRMDIPVPYTSTMAGSVDNFGFQNVGYGEFTGVLAYRPLEMLYFRY